MLNAGSSSVKFQLLAPEGRSLLAGVVERVEDDIDAALADVVERLRASGFGPDDIQAVGHRVVHGGSHFTRPVLVDDDVVRELEEVSKLAPLHNPRALAGIRAARTAFPHAPSIAVFDTAFFADLPAAAATYAVEMGLARREGVRRYGMHGISHQYVAGAAARFLERDPADLALITLHLGNGASAAATRGGRPVDTSMGMTPAAGLVMGTRTGDIDPGVLIHLLRHAGLGVEELDALVNHRSGLLGLAGVSDYRDLISRADAGDPDAALAHEVYCRRIRHYVGAYLAQLGGADAIVFAGGVGEHQARVRADSLAGLERLGIAIDAARNEAPYDGPRVISEDGSPVVVLVVPTDEERAIADAVRSEVRRRR